MKTRYFIYISFKGTSYHGWQVQPNSVTVQKILDEALTLVLSEKIQTIGAGRTDTGVHARLFCAHFDSVSDGLTDDKNLIYRLNRFLPRDISVNSLIRTIADAHARFSAISRTYRYYMSTSKDPFNDDQTWLIPFNPDLQSMNEACKILIKHDDFSSFARLHSDTKTNICRIFSAGWIRTDNNMVFTIKADRFLRNMVRAIVGTCIDVGRGKLTLEDFEMIILARDRCRAGKSAPAKGLFLEDISYPEELFV